MPIRVEHQAAPGAVGMAAYATGLGRRRQRERKYAQDLWMQERRHQQGMEDLMTGLKYRSALGGRAAGGRLGGVAGGGTLVDPLADNPALSAEERRRRRALRDARDRKTRMGKGIPAEWEPIYTSPAQIEQTRKEKEAELKREQVLEDKARQRKWDLADTAAQNRRADRTARAGALLEIPEWAPKDIAHRLQNTRAGLVEALTGGIVDWSEGSGQAAEIEKAIDEYETEIKALQPPDANANIRYKNPKTGRTSPTQTGEFTDPVRMINDQPVTDPDFAAQRDAQQAAREKEAAAAAEVIQKRQTKAKEIWLGIQEKKEAYDGPFTSVTDVYNFLLSADMELGNGAIPNPVPGSTQGVPRSIPASTQGVPRHPGNFTGEERAQMDAMGAGIAEDEMGEMFGQIPASTQGVPPRPETPEEEFERRWEPIHYSFATPTGEMSKEKRAEMLQAYEALQREIFGEPGVSPDGGRTNSIYLMPGHPDYVPLPPGTPKDSRGLPGGGVEMTPAHPDYVPHEGPTIRLQQRAKELVDKFRSGQSLSPDEMDELRKIRELL